MQEANRPWLTERFKHALQLLACAPEIQFGKFPDFARVPDELALEFDNFRVAFVGNFRSELTAEQLSCVELIDEYLSSMSKECYCDEAVSISPEWQHIRRLGAKALNAFGWPVEDPPSYAHEFVRGS
jgi:hypothetical protein